MVLLWTLRRLYFFKLDFSLDICPWVGPLCFYFFKEPTCCFAQWLYRFTFLPAVEQGSFSSTPSPAFIIRRLLFLSCCETCRISVLLPGINLCPLHSLCFWCSRILGRQCSSSQKSLFSKALASLSRPLKLWVCFYYFLLLLLRILLGRYGIWRLVEIP